jgi:hypothetical protein
MVAVAIVALDFAAIRTWLGFDSRMANALLLGVLPMVNVLAGGILIVQQHPGSRPFLLGFVAFGAMALALCVFLSFFHDAAALDAYLGLLSEPWEMIIRHAPPFNTDLIRAFVIVVWVGWPQAAFALIGGFFSRTYRITITKRSAPTPC